MFQSVICVRHQCGSAATKKNVNCFSVSELVGDLTVLDCVQAKDAGEIVIRGRQLQESG